jgi:hypothetical protein
MKAKPIVPLSARPATLSVKTHLLNRMRSMGAVRGDRCTVSIPYGRLRGTHSATFLRRYASGRIEVRIELPDERHVFMITDPENVLTFS